MVNSFVVLLLLFFWFLCFFVVVIFFFYVVAMRELVHDMKGSHSLAANSIWKLFSEMAICSSSAGITHISEKIFRYC